MSPGEVRPISLRSLLRRTPKQVAAPPGLAPLEAAGRTLRDDRLDQQLRTEGYAVVDLLADDVVEELLARCREVHPTPVTTWTSDFYTGDEPTKREVHELLSAAMRPALARHFTGHRSLLHNFILNWPGPDGGLPLHQHSSVVDETRFRSVIVWCALNDADEANGTLHVVERSHRVQVGPRPERAPSWVVGHEAALLERHLTSVPVRAGQALVFDNQLLHCSFANQTTEPRASFAAIVVPDEAEAYFYEAVDEETVRLHRLTAEHFLTQPPGDFEWSAPDDLEVVGEWPWSPTKVAPADLAALLPPGGCRHDSP